MKITLSPLVAALRGRAGGAVTAVTRGVQYVKAYARPHGAPTEAQLAQRAQISRMAAWWRSLPDNVRAFINEQGNLLGISGFALFTRTQASLHSPVYNPIIIGDNPSLQHIYELTCLPPYNDNLIQVTWKVSHAIPHYFVHFFHMLHIRPPSETTWEDVVTYRPDCTAIVETGFAQITGLASATEYWIVGCVAKHVHMPATTVFSGGWADVGKTTH